MKPDQIVALLASLRMAEEAGIASAEARIAQIDAVMRGFSNQQAAIRCPVCGSEDLANADTHGGRVRICRLCDHAFNLADQENPTP